MSRRALAVALVVLVALAGYVAYVKSRDAVRESAEVRLGDPILLTPRESLVVLEVTRRQGAGIAARFERDDNGWRLLKGPDGLDASRVPDVIYTWSLVRPVGRVEDPGALATYGLEPPGLVIRAVSRDREATTLALGDRAPVGIQYYARIGGRPDVYLVDPSAVNLLTEVDVLLGLEESPSTLR